MHLTKANYASLTTFFFNKCIACKSSQNGCSFKVLTILFVNLFRLLLTFVSSMVVCTFFTRVSRDFYVSDAIVTPLNEAEFKKLFPCISFFVVDETLCAMYKTTFC